MQPVIVALVTLNRDRGALEAARAWAQRLVELSPDDPAARQLVAELER